MYEVMILETLTALIADDCAIEKSSGVLSPCAHLSGLTKTNLLFHVGIFSNPVVPVVHEPRRCGYVR